VQFHPEAWHNIAEGRLFVLGCGPSLIEQLPALKKLSSEATMTCNGMGRWAELPFTPTYHGTTDVPYYKWLNAAYGPWKETHRVAFQRAGEEQHESFYTVPTAPDSVQVSSHGMAAMGEEWEDMRTARTTPLTLVQLGWWMGYRDFYFLGIEQTRGYAWASEQTISVNGRADFPIDKNAKYLLAIQRSAERMRSEIEKQGGTITDCTLRGFLNGQAIPPGATRHQRMTENSVTIKRILPYQDIEEVLRE
jgi:hypothetical protein